jgi:hypothetical protein
METDEDKVIKQDMIIIWIKVMAFSVHLLKGMLNRKDKETRRKKEHCWTLPMRF